MFNSEIPHSENLYRYLFTGYTQQEKEAISAWIKNEFDPFYLGDTWLFVEWLAMNGFDPSNPYLKIPDRDDF